MKMLPRILAALTIILTAASCADKKTEDVFDVEQRSFEAWMAEYHPQARAQGDGTYMEWIRNNVGGKPISNTGNWILLNYTGKTLVEGNVFKTRYEDIARQEGTFTLRTNYAPQLLYSTYNSLTAGENFAMARMKEGDKAIVYMPSRLAYQGIAQTFSNGYGGHTVLPKAMIPVQIELEVVKIIPDVDVREKELLDAYAKSDEGGMTDSDILEGTDGKIYAKVISKKTSTGLGEGEDDPYSKVLGTDDAHVFMRTSVIQEDGTFLVDTNIDSLTVRYWKDYTKNVERTVVFNHSASSYMKAFKEAFDKLEITWQSHFRIITTSAYAYGADGNTSSGLTEPYGEVQAYTPLVVDIYVQPKDWDPTEDEPATDYGQDD